MYVKIPIYTSNRFTIVNEITAGVYICAYRFTEHLLFIFIQLWIALFACKRLGERFNKGVLKK